MRIQEPDPGRLDPSGAELEPGGLTTRSLVERIKELNCLYEISRLSTRAGIGIHEFLSEAVEILRSSWQYPDITRVRIEFDGFSFETPGYRPSPWMQQASLCAGTDQQGVISVVYLEERPEEDKGPFLHEERRLIDTVARDLGTILMLHLSERARRESEERYATLIEHAGDGVIIVRDGIVCFANQAFARMVGLEEPEEVSGQDLISLIGRDQVPEPMTMIDLTGVRYGETLQETVLQHKNGSRMAIEISTSVIPFQEGQAVMAVIRDITLKRFLEQEIVSIGERERASIGQDLHDGICQYLAGIAVAGGALERSLVALGQEEAETARTIRQTAQEALEQTRAMARTLSPVTIAPHGLMAGLQDLAYQIEQLFGVTCLVDSSKTVSIEDATVAAQIYRITQEAINNAVRHGQAEVIQITLSRNGDLVTLEVRDDGVGIDPRAHEGAGMGLKIMNHRAHMIDAVLLVEPHPEGGTAVRCTFSVQRR